MHRPITSPLSRPLADAVTQGRGVGFPVLSGFAMTHLTYSSWVSSLASTGVTVEDLGTDTGGANHIYGLSYGSDEKPVLFLLGGVHGQHEWPNGYVLRQFMAHLASPPAGFEAYFQRITDAFRVYCIPIANPYGWQSPFTYENANGVNLNRNFDAYWASYDGSMGSGGSAPFSEVETQIIRDKVLALEPVGFLDFHIQGGASGCELEPVRGGDEQFWAALHSRFTTRARPSEGRYVPFDGLPQAQQWARTITASNGKKPLTATFESGENETREEQSRLNINFAFQFCLAMADQVAAGWPQAADTSATIQPAGMKDTQISATAVNGNYGTNPVLSVGNASGIRRGLMAFPMSDIPPGAVIQSATLTLHCSSEGSTSDHQIGLHTALKPWFEGAGNSGETPSAGVDASTWTNRNHNGAVAWGAAGGQSGVDYTATASASALVTGTGPVTWDITADVQAHVNGALANYGWFLISAAEATANSRKVFVSSDEGVLTSQRPKLEIVYK